VRASTHPTALVTIAFYQTRPGGSEATQALGKTAEAPDDGKRRAEQSTRWQFHAASRWS